MPAATALSLPSSGIARVKFTPRSVVSVSASPFTGEQQAYAFPGQWWEAEIELAQMVRARAEPWVAAFLRLNGREGTFLLGDPLGAVPQGVATGTPLVAGAGQTGGTLATDGWTAGVTGILKAGDWLQLGSAAGAHLHKLTADADSDGDGAASLSIWPNLRASPNDGDPIVVQAARGLFRLDGPVPWGFDSQLRYGITFSAREAL